VKEIRAYKSLNGTIYQDIETADQADKRWITDKLEDELRDFLKEKTTPDGKIKMIAEKRIEVRALFDKYDDPELANR
jgi:hypothetical protein